MPWIRPTEADILTRMSAPELAAFRAAALGLGQEDAIEAQISAVVNMMRGYIARCPNVDMSTKEAGTIPASALHFALDILVRVIQQRPAGAVIEGTSGIRLDASSDAMKWLRDAAECKVAVDEVPPSTAPGAPIPRPRIKKRRRPNLFGI